MSALISSILQQVFDILPSYQFINMGFDYKRRSRDGAGWACGPCMQFGMRHLSAHGCSAWRMFVDITARL